MINKEYFEKQIKKHGKFKVYSPENIELTITAEPYIARVDNGTTMFHFDMDCKDIAEYSDHLGLYLNPTKSNTQEETK